MPPQTIAVWQTYLFNQEIPIQLVFHALTHSLALKARGSYDAISY